MQKLILFICNEDKATSLQRYLALKRMSSNVDRIFHQRLRRPSSLFKQIFSSLLFRIGLPIDYHKINQHIVQKNTKTKYDIILIEKCLILKPKTIKQIRCINKDVKLILYILDDFKNKGNQSRYFLDSIPLYDLIVTTKNYNVEEYYTLMAKKVKYIKNAYSIDHHTIPINSSLYSKYTFKSDITFIGTYEKERADFLVKIANLGYKIIVYGWSNKGKKSIKHDNIINMEKHIYSEEYANVIYHSKINLNFLRKSNRDNETTRTVEIPACGGFMLSERTIEQIEMFEEGKEAEYFDGLSELINKIEYYLTNEEERLSIAYNGYLKCRKADYSYENQLKSIFLSLNPNFLSE
jgi:spore maturation protein CgeB